MTRWGQGRNNRLRKQARRALDPHCQHCGSTDRLELDHTIPLAEGGEDTLENTAWLCHPCHAIKTQAEAQRGRARHNYARRGSRYRDPEPHPGNPPTAT